MDTCTDAAWTAASPLLDVLIYYVKVEAICSDMQQMQYSRSCDTRPLHYSVLAIDVQDKPHSSISIQYLVYFTRNRGHLSCI